MSFGNPPALLWGLLAVPIIALYWRGVRLRREVVATDMIWQQVLADDRARTAWRPWRRAVSLAVQLTILTLLVLAAADLLIPGVRRTVLVIDNSTGTSATAKGPSRLEAAKQAALAMLGRLRDADHMAVLTAGGAAGVRVPWTGNVPLLGEAIEGVTPTDRPADVRGAVALARRMLAGEKPGKIVVVSNAALDGAGELSAAADVEIVRVGKSPADLSVARRGPPLWVYLATAGLVLLAVQWCFYQRRWLS